MTLAFNLDLLRAIGILLVTNSHLDMLYTDPRMALGGGLGNAIFFCLSGYGLAASFQGVSRGFSEWYLRRISRIYPSVFFVGLVAVVYFFRWSELSFQYLVKEFIWPTRHWFISAIVVFYIPFYCLLKVKSHRAFYLAFLLMVVPYLIGYFWVIDSSKWSIEDGGLFKWIFYAQMMLLGGGAGVVFPNILRGNSLEKDGLLFVLFLTSYFAFKYYLSQSGAWQLQGGVHLLTIPVLVFLVRLCTNQLVQGWMVCSVFSRPISYLAMISLEVYLVQYIPFSNAWLISLPFPYGAFLALLIVFVFASVVFYISLPIKKFLSISRV